jgi:hypothetical protein
VSAFDLFFLLGFGGLWGAVVGYHVGRCHEAEAGEDALRDFYTKQRRLAASGTGAGGAR